MGISSGLNRRTTATPVSSVEKCLQKFFFDVIKDVEEKFHFFRFYSRPVKLSAVCILKSKENTSETKNYENKKSSPKVQPLPSKT